MSAENPFAKILGSSAAYTKEDAAHYEAVGRFVTAYANAEASVHMLARRLSGLSDEKARIVFGGMRLPDISGRVREMMKLDTADAASYSEVDACLLQLSVIAERRHKLVHRSTTYFQGLLLVTNALTVKSTAHTESETYEIRDLEDMQFDCMSIYLRLTRISNPEALLALDAIEKQPWRYMPASRPQTKQSGKPAAIRKASPPET